MKRETRQSTAKQESRDRQRFKGLGLQGGTAEAARLDSGLHAAVENGVRWMQSSFVGCKVVKEVEGVLKSKGGFWNFDENQWGLSLSFSNNELLLSVAPEPKYAPGAVATYGFCTGEVLQQSERLWAGLDTVFVDKFLESAAENKITKGQCVAYAKFNQDLSEWTMKFNADWDNAASRLFAVHTWENKVGPDSSVAFGVNTVEVKVYDINMERRTNAEAAKKGAATVYKFHVNYFEHTVEDGLFFCKGPGLGPSDDCDRTLARFLIKQKYGQQRTLLGMLSTWNEVLCNFNLADINWLSKESVAPRAVVVDDAWESFGSKDEAEEEMSSWTLTDGLANEDKTVLDYVGKKAVRHGRQATPRLLKLVKDLGYYGLIAAGGPLKVERPAEEDTYKNIKVLRGMVVTDVCV